MSLQAETLHLLQDVETTQADNEAVYWIPLLSKRKDVTDVTPLSRKPAT